MTGAQADSTQTAIRPDMRIAVVGIVVAGAMLWGLWQLLYPAGFTEADIDKVKQEISAEFGKRNGVTVSKVVLAKENSRKLSGYVDLESSLLGHVVKMCQATYGEHGSDGYWACN